MEREGLSVNHCSQIGVDHFLASLANEEAVARSLVVASPLFKVLGKWRHNEFTQKRVIWVRYFGYPFVGWSENLIKAFGQRFGNLLEIHSRNLSREDCSLLHLCWRSGSRIACLRGVG